MNLYRRISHRLLFVCRISYIIFFNNFFFTKPQRKRKIENFVNGVWCHGLFMS